MKQKNIYIIILSLFLLLTTLNFVISEEENKDLSLEIIDNNITFYTDRVFSGDETVMNPDGYLFEGESMEFKVKVYSSKGIEEIKDVYMTVNDKIEVNCHKEERINNFNQIWYCHLTTEYPEDMYEFGLVELVAVSVDGEKTSKYLGTFFFNPVISFSADGNIMFENITLGPQTYNTKKIYSKPVIITNDVDDNSNVSLNVLITATGFTDKDICYNGRVPLSAISYYAENEEYSTKNDSRADKEGYVKIIDSDHYERTLNSYLILNHSLLNEGENTVIKFRISVPKNCNGEYTGTIIIWGKSRGSSVGIPLELKLNVAKDSTPPEAKIRFNSNLFEVNGFDDKINVSTTKKITCLKKNGDVCSKELRRFVIKDEAENDLALNVIYEKVGGQTKTTISSLDYNGGKLKDYNEDGKIESNWFWLYTFTNPNFPEKVIQPLKIGNEYVTTYYNPTTNKTRIETKNKTGSKSYTEEGYNYVELRTDKGKLRYEIKKGVLPIISQDVYNELEKNEWVDVIVRIKDTSSIDMNIDKSELEKQLEERDKRLDAISKEVISNLNEDELKSYRLGLSGGFSGSISKEGLEKLRYNIDISKINKNIGIYAT